MPSRKTKKSLIFQYDLCEMHIFAAWVWCCLLLSQHFPVRQHPSY